MSHAGDAVRELVPMLNVPDVPSTCAWYEALGFERLGEHAPDEGPINWALLRLDDVTLMLNGGGRQVGAGERRDVVSFLYTADVDALYTRMKARLPPGCDAPADHWTGLRQFIVCDPNGFELCFATRQ
jgi:catechol 2,3-dioxygenase-like lactoylglutathione lyase family enzyme